MQLTGLLPSSNYWRFEIFDVLFGAKTASALLAVITFAVVFPIREF